MMYRDLKVQTLYLFQVVEKVDFQGIMVVMVVMEEVQDYMMIPNLDLQAFRTYHLDFSTKPNQY